MSLAWGIAATGRIAQTVGALIAAQPDMSVAAVASRDLGRAQRLAAELGAPRGYDSYRALVEDPAVQAVYVATPHTAHAEVVELALEAGLAVLCEKPMTHTLAETERLVALAGSTGTFLMEAMWNRFNPLVQQLRTLVAAGELGELRSVHARFGFAAPYDPEQRLWSPDLAGGALLDLGVYVLDAARLLLGSPETLSAVGSLAPSGVDAESSLLLSWPSGAHALLEVSLLAELPGRATVVGTAGWAELGPASHAPTRLLVQTGGEVREHINDDRQAGYVGELREVAAAVEQGRSQSEVMPLSESVETMRLLAQARAQLSP